MLILALILLIGLSFGEESFEEFLRKEQEGYLREQEDFRRYLEEVNREFAEYKRIVEREFREFRREVIEHWGVYEGSDRKKWVEYSPDYRVKRVFDFERGELRIEVRGEVENFRELVKEELKDFVTETTTEAFRRDRVLSGVEKQVRRKLKHVRTAPLEDRPILTPLIFGKEEVTRSELERGVEELVERGEFRRKNSRVVVNTFRIELPPKRLLLKAKRYKPYVVEESRKRKISHPLIFAIIHTESHFNPLARSPVPAYGLMQIVPHTAGRDVTKFLFGKPVILSPSYLYNARNNIRIGTAYLHLLYYRYFRGVRNPESRLYCTIAAYNTGPGNVARAFTGTGDLRKAIRVINRMTPREVYRTLLKKLPYAETRDYLRKVSSRIAVYRNL